MTQTVDYNLIISSVKDTFERSIFNIVHTEFIPRDLRFHDNFKITYFGYLRSFRFVYPKRRFVSTKVARNV